MSKKKPLSELEAELLRLQIRRQKHKADFQESLDFYAGHFLLQGPIIPPITQPFLGSLRAFSRLHPGAPIVIQLDSPGGDIFDGFHVIDELLRLRKAGHHVTVRVRGIAASMAGVVLQAADKREIGASGFIMLHRASFAINGKAFEVEDEIEATRKLESRIIDIFAERSKRSRKVFEGFFKKRADLYFSASEALDLGLADEVA